MMLSGQPLRGQSGKVREAELEGQWYPGDREELARTVDAYLAGGGGAAVEGRVRALILPHAGHVYSGPTTGLGVSRLPDDVSRVVVLAFSHRYPLRGGSVREVAAYRNALGDIPLDPAAAELRKTIPYLKDVPAAETRENSLEVLLPFLQRRLKRPFSLVPIVLGGDFDPKPLVAALADLMDDPKTVLVASSDLSHYHPYDDAQRRDRSCVQAILDLDIERLRKQELCGQVPVTVLLMVARSLGWKATLVDYRNSGDTAGDKDGVVGYAAIAFADDGTRAAAAAPAAGVRRLAGPEERRRLLELARETVAAKAAGRPLPPLPSGSPLYEQELGCFVTLNKDGDLRGCIGNILPAGPLAKSVQRNAISAAFHDPRFEPVEAGELDRIRVEISLLTQPQPLVCLTPQILLERLRPGVDVLVIRKGLASATFLPQVWEQLPGKEQFLAHLCRKAGLAPDAWRDVVGMTFQTYQAEVFGEETTGRE